MISRRAIAVASVAALGLARPGYAQGGAAPWNLCSVRFDTRTSDFIYAAYGYGDVFAMVGALQNPRSGYTELLGAVGRKFAFTDGGASQFAAIGMARASESWYAQLYFLPTVHRGRLWFRATSETYLPTERSGTPQFALSPASLTVEMTPHLEAGIAADVSVARDAAASTAIGPELRVAVPHAIIGLDAQRVIHQGAGRLRVFFVTAF